jgi:hypothetical protein
VSEQIAGFFLGIGHDKPDALAPHLAGVADLPAALGVEGRLVHHHRPAFAFLQLGNFLAILDQRGNHTLGSFGFVAEEFRRSDLLAQRKPHALLRRVARAGP